MIYDDGYPMDSDLRVTICPLCGNQEFSQDAFYCRICGTYLFNPCEGSGESGFNHNNIGNARFCEYCGAPTYFAREKFLRPFSEVQEEYMNQYNIENPEAIKNFKCQDHPFKNT